MQRRPMSLVGDGWGWRSPEAFGRALVMALCTSAGVSERPRKALMIGGAAEVRGAAELAQYGRR